MTFSIEVEPSVDTVPVTASAAGALVSADAPVAAVVEVVAVDEPQAAIPRASTRHRIAQRQHRTIASADISESFVPILQFEKLEIHKVFLRFPNFILEQNLSLLSLAELCGAAQIIRFIFVNLLLLFSDVSSVTPPAYARRVKSKRREM